MTNLPQSLLPPDEGAPSSTVELWKTCIQLWDAEANRFWIRSNIFLLINGALVSFLSVTRSEPSVLTGGSVLGVLLTLIWFRVNSKGKWYIDRWRPVMTALEVHSGIQVFHYLKAQKDPSGLKSSTTYMKYGIIVFMLAYSFLCLISLHRACAESRNPRATVTTHVVFSDGVLSDESLGLLRVQRSLLGESARIRVRMPLESHLKIPASRRLVTSQLTQLGFRRENITVDAASDNSLRSGPLAIGTVQLFDGSNE